MRLTLGPLSIELRWCRRDDDYVWAAITPGDGHQHGEMRHRHPASDAVPHDHNWEAKTAWVGDWVLPHVLPDRPYDDWMARVQPPTS